MTEIAPSGTVELLQHFHGKLEVHFRELHQLRTSLDPVSPVFALEHDLSDAELDLLRGAVRLAIRDYYLTHFRKTWLPFVVYAAEMGYGYEGDEYWTTFSSETPRWTDQERSTIRDWFLRFANEFGGARPTGAWARHFTIIAWPITHAVLPVYLQRQFAKLLFDFRTGLSSSLLSDPDALGARLAARAGSYSDRFRQFSQNTALLGQVAVALLSGDDEESPYLVKSTLDRMVDGLSHERQTRQWLTSAQQAASRVRSTGFTRGVPAGTPKPKQERLPTATDPRFFLRYLDGAWNAYAELPDMTPLSERLPHVYDELRDLRARVTGGRRPVPRGGLVYGGQEIRFESWPDPSKPFVQLERGTDPVNAILADQSVMTAGPWWLYRRQGAGLAVEVKGRFLRPGHEYILVGKDGQQPPSVSWCSPTSLQLSGAAAYRLDVPETLTEADASHLVTNGMSALSTVAIRPVGIVASAWDGEGAVECLAGESAIIGIRSELTPARCLVTVEGSPHFVPWPKGESEMILSLDGLDVGPHEVGAVLFGADGQELTSGLLAITIRDPQVRPENATVGEGIRMLASPARPTLAELWDERASVTIDGPFAAEAELVVVLRGSDNAVLAVVRRKVELPTDENAWAAHAKSIRAERLFKDAYDEAESCVLTVHRDGVGMASLTCERGFQPLRWRFSKNHDGSRSATLHDRTDGGNTRVDFFPVDAPMNAVSYEPGRPVALPPTGGLLRAVSEEAAAVVVAPTNPNAVISLGEVHPHVPYGDKSIAGIMKLVEAHWVWATAELPADPFAVHQQHLALDAVARANVMLVCGSHWASLERKLERTNDPADHLEDMQDAVGNSQAQKALAESVGRSLYRWLQPEALLPGFADLIAPLVTETGIKGQPSAARFLLTLAGRPGFITEWLEPDRSYLLERIITSPVLLRAARFAVLGTRILNDLESAERGF